MFSVCVVALLLLGGANGQAGDQRNLRHDRDLVDFQVAKEERETTNMVHDKIDLSLNARQLGSVKSKSKHSSKGGHKPSDKHSSHSYSDKHSSHSYSDKHHDSDKHSSHSDSDKHSSHSDSDKHSSHSSHSSKGSKASTQLASWIRTCCMMTFYGWGFNHRIAHSHISPRSLLFSFLIPKSMTAGLQGPSLNIGGCFRESVRFDFDQSSQSRMFRMDGWSRDKVRLDMMSFM